MFACAQWRKQDRADLVSRSVCLFLLFSENHPLVLFTIWNHVWWDLSNQPPFVCTGSHLQSSCCAAYLRFPSPCIYFCVHKVLIAIHTWLRIYNKTFFFCPSVKIFAPREASTVTSFSLGWSTEGSGNAEKSLPSPSHAAQVAA